MPRAWPTVGAQLLPPLRPGAGLAGAGPLWRPFPDPAPGVPHPQRMALESKADIIGYGGAAGSGKSGLLMGAATTKHWHSVIFRRVFPSARGLIEEARKLLNRPNDRYNEGLHVWRTADGRLIEFGQLQDEKAAKRQQGRARDLFGFDELTEFPESFFRYVITWNRTTRKDVKPRVICTFNPPTDDEGLWVVKFFAPWIDEEYQGVRAKSGELRWFITDDEGNDVEVPEGTPKARSRTFIAAKLTDNPILLEAGYEATIASLPEPYRSAMRGNFNVARQSDPWAVIPRAWVEAAQRRWAPGGQERAGQTGTGVDVARGGKDQTMIARRFGDWYAELEAHPGSDTPDGPAVARLVLAGHKDGPVWVDVVGYGASAVDQLMPVLWGVVGFNAGAGAGDERDADSDSLGFVNQRALSWWRLREALDPSRGSTIALPPDSLLRAELCAPRYFVRSGRIAVESKEELRKRLGRSTDRADAVIMAHMAVSSAPLIW